MNVDRFRQFILFFEQSVHENLRELLEEIRGVVSEKPLLLTPLVMDCFDINPETKPVELQVRHLREGISRCTALCPDDRVLSFLGYDLRRLKKSLLPSYRLLKTVRRSSCHTRAPQPGAVSQWRGACTVRGILPVVYKTSGSCYRALCRYASYSLYRGGRVRYYTQPFNWRRLLARLGFQNLRLNLAHVGRWEDMAARQNTGKLPVAEEETDRAGYEPGTWAPVVVSLLKKYPAVYADLSAFNFASRPACRALKKLLERDERGDYGDGYPLRKKLLWGSDVPMVVPALNPTKTKGRSPTTCICSRVLSRP